MKEKKKVTNNRKGDALRQKENLEFPLKSIYPDFQWAFGLNRFSLDLIGVWPSDRDDVACSSFRHLRIPVMLLWMSAALILPQLYALYQVFRELTLMIDNLATNFAIVTATIKLYLLWKNRQALWPVIRQVSRDWMLSKTIWEHEVMVKQARRARIFTLSGYSIMFMSFVGFVVAPIFGLYSRMINNITDPGDGPYFPLQTGYPFEVRGSPLFEILFVSQIIGGSFVGVSFSVPDNFFGALVFHVSGQCEILKSRMEEIFPISEEAVLGWIAREKYFLRLKLRGLVGTHKKLIRFVDAVEESFNVLILIQIICLSLNFCFLGFGVIKSIGTENERPPVTQIATFAGTLLNFLIHLFVYCLASEVLAEHSSGFYYAVYCSGWYLLPAKYARLIIPIMMQSANPLQLTAGKFFYLSLNTYLGIIKTSFGYVSMLLAVSN